MALLLLPCLRSFADVTLLDAEKSKLQLYGFFKLDAVYQDAGVNGLTIPRYAVAGDGNAYLSATHSRFGFKYSGTPLNNGMNVSAVLEWDFLDTTSPNQMKPRFRQGFFSLQKNSHTLLFGQAWDLFSPLGPTTLMTNGYLWQTGNLGFRHAQVRYAFSGPRLDFAVSLNDPASSGGWKSKMPVLQSRLGLKLGAGNKFQLGLSGIYGRENTENATVAFKNKVNISGLGLDWNLVPCKHLTLKGEYALGENLAYVLSRASTYADTQLQEFAAKKVSSFWTELLLAKDKLSGWLGYAFEDLNDEGQLAANELKKTSSLLAGIQYAAGSGVSFGLEFSHLLSQHYQSEKIKTNQLIFSAILNL
jgi:hypothetical protein